jgi:phosphopantothenoylcysteine decarboxylase/phosphopantothenate--cysteine ligase
MTLARKNILITAGPTRESMDPVRYLTNPSSGAMGLALADVLSRRGAHVTLVLGPTCLPVPPKNIRTIRVVTALEMHAAVKKNLARSDAFIATAAVGDWRFQHPPSRKLKKGTARKRNVTLLRNPDILAEAGREKKKRKSFPLLIGFSLETENMEKFALKKLKAKNLDLIIGNGPRSFSSRTIRPLWAERSGERRRLPLMSKKNLALKIARWMEERWKK